MSEKRSTRALADINWQTESTSFEAVQTGCLLKIADNIEKMAQNVNRLENDRNMYKRWADEREQQIYRLQRVNSALRGVITKLKRRVQSNG